MVEIERDFGEAGLELSVGRILLLIENSADFKQVRFIHRRYQTSSRRSRSGGLGGNGKRLKADNEVA